MNMTAAQSFKAFRDPMLTDQTLLPRLAWLRDVVGPRLDKFLGYYRNPMTELTQYLPGSPTASLSVRPYRQFQEMGLPARITGFRTRPDGTPVPNGAVEVQRKEVAIENDIAWRMHTLVDFVAGRMPAISSTAGDPALRKKITALIAQLLDAAGSAALLQELVLMGAIHGSAWLRIEPTAELLAKLQSDAHGIGDGERVEGDTGGAAASSAADAGGSGQDIASMESPVVTVGENPLDITRWLHLKTVDATRICPLPGAQDLRYVAVLERGDAPAAAPRAGTLLQRLGAWITRAAADSTVTNDFSFALFGPSHWQRYVHGTLAEEGDHPLGFVPFVRYLSQNDPAAGTRVGPAGSGAIDAGVSDVEPLIGLQDELNTRLSDRAYRVTMTSFRMFLGKGIEGFTSRPVGPGQVWSTDNPDAAIDTFGGDTACPSEDAHINEVREALDKISGVPPVAAGLIRGKVGNLTSAVALRITLIALLARAERKRAGLNETLETLVQRVLELLDRAGVLHSTPADRGIDINWPTPLPESDMDRLAEAQTKLALGIPRDVVLTELGYGEMADK